MIRLLSSLIALTTLVSCQTSAPPNAKPVTGFEVDRYLGTWYEISKYPVSFEEGLVGVKAEYSLREDGDIRVLNSGYRDNFDGELSTAEGHAWLSDAAEPSKLRVRFFWPFHGAYWVIALDPAYQWSVVGEPDRGYLWILSRTPTMAAGTYDRIVAMIHELGYDTSRLEKMPQR